MTKSNASLILSPIAKAQLRKRALARGYMQTRGAGAGEIASTGTW